MNNFEFTLIAVVILFTLGTAGVFAQTPTYTLTITNDNQPSANTYEFDIDLLQTGSNSFEYANNSQYFININPAIINGGSLSFTIVSGTCQLNAAQQIPSSKVSFDAVNNRLRIAAQAPSGAGTGTIISSTVPGIRLGRFRVTNTVNFAAAQSNLTWYDFNSGFYTKVFAYVGGVNTEVTDTTKHIININNAPLPVTISSFTSAVIKNSVELRWSSAAEVNNKGFAIQRNATSDTAWYSIGFVAGSGTTNIPKTYTFNDIGLNAGAYKYRLKQIDYNGNFSLYNLSPNVVIGAPGNFGVSQNYPNPSNPKSRIDYQLPQDENVSIKVYDMTGREIVTLFNGFRHAGYYSTDFDGTNLASGVYIYRIKTDHFTETKKMVLVK